MSRGGGGGGSWLHSATSPIDGTKSYTQDIKVITLAGLRITVACISRYRSQCNELLFSNTASEIIIHYHLSEAARTEHIQHTTFLRAGFIAGLLY